MTVSPTTIHALIHRMRHGLIAGDPAAANDWVAHTSLSVDETVILLPPPSTFSRCINSDEDRASPK